MASEDPERIRPSTGTVGRLRAGTTQAADSVYKKLDVGHDWLYRRLQRLFENMDIQFAGDGAAPVVVPLSPLRLGLANELVRSRSGLRWRSTPDIEASLRLPNIERRFNLVITSADLRESPVAEPGAQNPLRIGALLSARKNLDLELGLRANGSPAVFAAARWMPRFTLGAVQVIPFAKLYAQTAVGLGASSGLSFEHWNNAWVMRSTSYANWVFDSNKVEWTQVFVLGHAQAVLQQRRYGSFATGRDLACGTAAHISASGERGSRVSVYEASLLMKRPLHGGWLYGYAEPLVRWERRFGWHGDVGIRVGFDALFWGLAKLPGEIASYCG